MRTFDHNTTWNEVQDMTAEEAIHILSRDANSDGKEWSARPHKKRAAQIAIAALQRQKDCPCCRGDLALFWRDNENNAFVDSRGEVSVFVHDHLIRFSVEYCPHCGRKF